MSETAFAGPEMAQEHLRPFEETLGAAHSVLQPFIENQDVAQSWENLVDAVEIKRADETSSELWATDEKKQAFEEQFAGELTQKLDSMLVAAGIIREAEAEGETWTDRLQQQSPDVAAVITEINVLAETLNPPAEDPRFSYLGGPLLNANVFHTIYNDVPAFEPTSQPNPAFQDGTRFHYPDAIDVEEIQTRPALEASADAAPTKTEVVIESPKKAAATTEVLSNAPKIIDVEPIEVSSHQEAA